MLLEAAREALVAAIHIGLALAAVIAVVSVWQSAARAADQTPAVRSSRPFMAD